MAHTVEISLRVPSLRIRKEGAFAPETITNSDVRFSTRLDVETVPKTGTILEVAVGASQTFPCEVVRSDWRDDKNMFVVACRYAKRSITPADYQALVDAPGWHVQPLL
jgi:hypothetical protein